MRIALDLRCVFAGMGGIGRYAYNLLKQYAEIDARNEYVCLFTHLSPPEPLRLPPRFALRIFEAGMIDERFDQTVLPTVLEEEDVDVYHNPTFAVPLVRTRARTVATIHDVVFRRHPELVEPRLRDYLDAATRRACRGADRLVTVSEFSRAEIADLYGVPADRIETIHNGIAPPGLPTEAGTPAKAGARPSRDVREVGLLPGGYILYVGSIEPKKNVDLLVGAFGMMRRNGLTLALAGSPGPGGREPPRRADVRVLGYVEEEMLEALYAGALAFVYPSRYEGFGFPPLEAMARGVPTIVSDASSLPEIVGDDAIRVGPDDAAGLAAAIERLAGDEALRRELGERGRRRAAGFQWRRSAKRHLEVYESAA